MMRASVATGVEQFSADRMVREYFEQLYPAGPAKIVASGAATVP